MADDITINGVSLLGMGFLVEKITGHRSHMDLAYPIVEVPGRNDAVLLSPDGVVTPRRIQVTAWQSVPSTLARSQWVPTLMQRRDELSHLLSRRSVELRFSDMSGRYISGRVEPFEFQLIQPELIQRAHKIVLTFVCPDPRYYDDNPTVSALPTGGAIELAVGSAPTSLRITIAGPAVSPELIYRDSNFVERSRMNFSGFTVGSGASLIIDTEKMTITDGNGDNRSLALLSGRFPVLDPLHAPGLSGPYPSLTLTAGTGSVSRRRAWL